MKGTKTIQIGRPQTALAAWKLATEQTNADIIKVTRLSDRTITAAILGRGISYGTASLIAGHTGLSADTIYGGTSRDAWVFDFDRLTSIEQVTPVTS